MVLPVSPGSEVPAEDLPAAPSRAPAEVSQEDDPNSYYYISPAEKAQMQAESDQLAGSPSPEHQDSQPAVPQTPPSGEVPPEDMPAANAGGMEVPPEDMPTDYSSPGQMAMTAIEGARKGVLGPLVALQQKYMPDTSNPAGEAQEEANRAQANPWIHGIFEALGLAAGPQGAVIGAGGEAVAQAAGMGRIDSAVLKGATEGGLFQGSDEISKAILGQGDPNAPVSSALANMGAAALLGGGIGGTFGSASAGLAKLGETQIGRNASQFLEDLGNRLKFNHDNPDLGSAVTKELQDFHTTTQAASDEIYGASGLKAQAIEKLTQDVTPEQLADHVNEVTQIINRAPKALQSDAQFQEVVDNWKARVTPQVDPITNQAVKIPSPAETFQATDAFKRQLQEWGQYDKKLTPLSEQPFRNAAQGVAVGVKNSLTDSAVWNKAGEFQAGLNKAVSDFIPANKDFLSKFTEKVEREPVVSPGKVQTYVNQLGKPNAEIKQSMLQNYVDAAQKFRDAITDLHGRLGLDSPIQPASLNASLGTLGKLTAGQEAADTLFHPGITNASEKISAAAIGHSIGGLPGAAVGYLFGPMIEKGIGRAVRKYGVPMAIRALSSGSAKNIAKALEYADSVTAGSRAIKKGVDGLFKSVGREVYEAHASEKDREKLRKYIAEGEFNRQMQSQTNAKGPAPIRQFAQGGEVAESFQQPEPSKPAAPVLQGLDGIAEAVPEQAMLMSAAKARINNYLNTIRPQKSAALPFDEELKDPERERSYDRALDLANEPLTILNHIKAGTITPETMQHFTAMYPELHNHLSQKITERMAQAQMDEEKPAYHTRQAMSMFLGAPVDSSMTPMSIQAAQSVFLQQAAKSQASSGGPSTKAKKGTAPLSKLGEDVMTGAQARASRASKD